MRLPASITDQPPDAVDVPPLPAAERGRWWVHVSSVIGNGVFSNVTGALIAVVGALYVGIYHAPWVRSLADHKPAVAQAGVAVSVAMAATPASAATPAPSPEPSAPPASPDHVAAARDRMEQRIYSQSPSRTGQVADNATPNDDAPALGNDGLTRSDAGRHHRGTRHVRSRVAWDAGWYKGA